MFGVIFGMCGMDDYIIIVEPSTTPKYYVCKDLRNEKQLCLTTLSKSLLLVLRGDPYPYFRFDEDSMLVDTSDLRAINESNSSQVTLIKVH